MKPKFIVQESLGDSKWYDDPDIKASFSYLKLLGTYHRDCLENPGHTDYYHHRIIERAEKVVRTFRKR